jgi:hypothetical protein
LIADDLGSDAGIALMHQDSIITEKVIHKFTSIECPILTVHDSYIISYGCSKLLRSVLTEAYEEASGQTSIRSEMSGIAMDDETTWDVGNQQPATMERADGYSKRYLDWMLHSPEIG